jgi:hypothetical protein
MAGRSSGFSDLKTRGEIRVSSSETFSRGGFDEMNVVLPPALTSYLASAGEAVLPVSEASGLLGWVWSITALTFLSAWIVRRWQAGDDRLSARLAPAARASTAVAPALAGIVPQDRAAPVRSGWSDMVAACLALRAPPTTDMLTARRSVRRPSPSLLPTRSTGTPTACSSGQTPPV